MDEWLAARRARDGLPSRESAHMQMRARARTRREVHPAPGATSTLEVRSLVEVLVDLLLDLLDGLARVEVLRATVEREREREDQRETEIRHKFIANCAADTAHMCSR